jgi:hypothetical protein
MEMIYMFIFYNAFPGRSIYYLYGPSINNQTYNTSIINYTHYERCSIRSTSRSLYFTIFYEDGKEIKVSSNALTELTSSTGNMIGLIPSPDNSQGAVINSFWDKLKACPVYQNMAFNTSSVSIYENQLNDSVAVINNGENYHYCSSSNITDLPHSIRFCPSPTKICINSTYTVSYLIFKL